MVKSCNVKLVNFCQNCEKIAKLIFLVKYLFDYNWFEIFQNLFWEENIEI